MRRARTLALVVATLVPVPSPMAGSDPADLRRAYARPPEAWPAATLDAGVAYVELGARQLPAAAEGIAARRAALGGRLFHDARLSRDGRTTCAGCHDPAHGFTVAAPKARGIGDRLGRRNPPGLLTASARASWGWDGRRTTLTDQVLAPLTAPDEMGNPTREAVLPRLLADSDLVSGFADAFPEEGLTLGTLAAALVAYLPGLDGPTRFDRFAGGDTAALSDLEIAGLHLFRTRARCANCHGGPLLTDEGYHNLKLSSFGEPAQDLGRFLVTGIPDDAGRFRTPSLRHVGQTAPYGHAGLFATLAGVVNLYDRGGGEVWARDAVEATRPLHAHAARLSPHIRPLGLTDDEKAALVAFLGAL